MSDKFCVYCGSKLDENGKCPIKCPGSQIKEAESETDNKKESSSSLIAAIILSFIFIPFLCFVIFGETLSFGEIRMDGLIIPAIIGLLIAFIFFTKSILENPKNMGALIAILLTGMVVVCLCLVTTSISGSCNSCLDSFQNGEFD